MRRAIIRIGYSSAIIMAGETAIAVVSGTTFDTFRLWVGITSTIILVGGVLAWSAGSGPKVWNMAGSIPLSSGTRRMWDTGSYAESESSPGTLPIAFGTGFVLLGVFIGLFGLGLLFRLG